MKIEGYNYIAVFLTFSCNLSCPYCITRLDGLSGKRTVSASDWISFFNSLQVFGDVPITLQGGEPTTHPEFYDIMSGISLEDKSFNLMTNLNFDVVEFSDRVPPEMFNRKAPFPSIRVSYHVGQIERGVLISRIRYLVEQGYNIGLYMLDHPKWAEEIKTTRAICAGYGIDFRLKEYLDRSVSPDMFKYHYDKDASVLCRNNDLIIGPDLRVYKCHYDLYTGRDAIIDIREEQPLSLNPVWMKCTYPTKCNPCDVKIKNNRFQEWGYCSVEIENV